MEQAAPGGGVLSILVGDQGKSGDPWLEEQGDLFSPFPTLRVPLLIQVGLPMPS